MQEPIYIAGPMSGIEELNYPAFRAMEKALRERGYTQIENPCNEGDDPEDDHPYDFYIRRGIAQLIKCRSIIMLPGWRNSRGARMEHSIAQLLEMEIIYQEEAA